MKKIMKRLALALCADNGMALFAGCGGSKETEAAQTTGRLADTAGRIVSR